MLYIVIILVIFILDDKIKDYIEKNKRLNESEEVLNGHLIIEKYYNKGAMLNFLQNNVKIVKYFSACFLILLAFFLLCIIPSKGKKLMKFALALIIGGASSNVYDRMKKGYVVDYFSFKFLKNIIFNVSDLFIFLGSLLILIQALFFDKKK